jgi:hypothetical protein
MSNAVRNVEEIGKKVNFAVYKYPRAQEREDRDDAYEDLVG